MSERWVGARQGEARRGQARQGRGAARAIAVSVAIIIHGFCFLLFPPFRSASCQYSFRSGVPLLALPSSACAGGAAASASCSSSSHLLRLPFLASLLGHLGNHGGLSRPAWWENQAKGQLQYSEGRSRRKKKKIHRVIRKSVLPRPCPRLLDLRSSVVHHPGSTSPPLRRI